MVTWVRPDGWQINDGPEHIYLEGKLTAFALKDESVPGTTRYGVGYSKDQMYNGWLDQRFIALGQAQTPWNSAPLPPWSPEQKDLYDEAIQNWLATTDTNTVRLTGEISIPAKLGTRSEAVTMLLAENASKDEKGELCDLLVIVSRLGFDWSRDGGMTAAQDGTAHAKQR
jgi:hypothetical protein